ncbi:Ureidoglycolate lyase [Rhodobacteraceae bacterium THAF1]|uniref:ureidoglycolate lyase n=1 Tax=Palleronia sp. THAF1 TaxID=2587842 RepID=UPI000F3AD457|nr:ureidoglycolate lyase [Palleronia sp. THAF1]QFU08146.1 Ureidoglycolate lyase [Palleronia sp. THAF1]VDC28697.1 Ureidoglycolate lyase [Rhodobacteraceae bacterium THAF1]
MSEIIHTESLTADAFASFGDVLAATGAPDKLINAGRCGRFHDRAQLDFADGQAGISIFQSETVTLPYDCPLMERHPLGSQAFIPMSADPFLVIVAADRDGTPDAPRAFVTAPGQGINLHRGVWHGVLTPLGGLGLFAVVDRIGEGANLEEYTFDTPFRVVQAD